MFVLVRHGLAGEKGAWRGSDDRRPLTPAGQIQAVRLAEALGDLGLTGLWSSPSERCRQTLNPLAERLGLPVQDNPALSVDAEVADVLAFLSSRDAAGSALCTHGEVVARLFTHWPDPLRREIWNAVGRGEDKGMKKGSALIVERLSPTDAQFRYLPPQQLRLRPKHP